jgi:ABC-type polar amino acid transport system ATPase subunit
MKDLKDIKTGFNSDAVWLIVGAVGTGKSSAADIIKKQGNFITIDDVRDADDVICAALESNKKLIVTVQRFSLLKTETLEKLFSGKISVIVLRIDSVHDAEFASKLFGLDEDKNSMIDAADLQKLSDRNGFIIVEDNESYSVDIVQF